MPNTCKTCGATDGCCGTLFDDECSNCYTTRETGEFFIDATLVRTCDELALTGAILE